MKELEVRRDESESWRWVTFRHGLMVVGAIGRRRRFLVKDEFQMGV